MSVKALRAQRRADGLCIDCSRKNDSQYQRCFECRVALAAKEAERKTGLRRALVIAAGMGLAICPLPFKSIHGNHRNPTI